MVLSVPAQARVFLACSATDMRKSFDGLCLIIQHEFDRDPYAGDVFTFFNRRRTYVKLIVWDGNGFWLVAKRLEGGTFEDWCPATDASTHVGIDRAQLSMLLEGIDLKKAKFRRHYKRSVRINNSSEEPSENNSRNGQSQQRRAAEFRVDTA